MSEDEFYAPMNSMSQTCLDLYEDLVSAGLESEGMKLLTGVAKRESSLAPTIAYIIGKPELGDKNHYAYPCRKIEKDILEEYQAKDEYARYLLGCIEYSDKRYARAHELFACSPTMWEAKRCEGVCLWREGKREEAIECLKSAIAQAPECDQLKLEYAYLLNKAGHEPNDAARIIKQLAGKLEDARDDICTELADAYNKAGRHEEALAVMHGKLYTPLEGGETALVRQHVTGCIGLLKKALAAGEKETALKWAKAGQVIPDNMRAGLWHDALIIPPMYEEAEILADMGKTAEAKKIYEQIVYMYVDYFSDITQADLPVYQAYAYAKLGQKDTALALLDKHIARWAWERDRTDSGYFKTTPFVISYVNADAKTERYNYYNQLVIEGEEAKRAVISA
jgi:tetratricopeptide (TPR) repeat protein